MRSSGEAVEELPIEPDAAQPQAVKLPQAAKPGLKHLPEPDVPLSTLTQFRRACGQQTAFIVKIASSESGTRPQPVLWNRPTLIIGKGEDCDLQLPHTEVSRQHAYFQIINERIYCADLGSRTGTHWSNGAVQAGWVEADESVSVGPYSLTFEPAPQLFDAERAEDEFASDDPQLDNELHDGQECFLDFLNAGQNVRRYRVTRDVTLIGSGDAAKVHLAHPSVSKAHCSIVRTDTGLWLIDLLSDDGTIVNGHVDSLAPLQMGDEFQVGRFLVSVHYGEDDTTSVPSFSTPSDVRPLNAERANESFADSLSRENVPDAPDDSPLTDAPLDHPQLAEQKRDEPQRDVPPPPETNLTALNQLAHLTAGLRATNVPAGLRATNVPAGLPATNVPAGLPATNVPAGLPATNVPAGLPATNVPAGQVGGLSEQFVLNIIKELGVMQQQALQHAQDSMKQTVSTLATTYKDRIDSLERQHAALRDQLLGLSADPSAPLGLPDATGGMLPPLTPWDGPDMADPEFSHLPEPDRGSYECSDPDEREAWIRERMQSVETELDKTRRGWGKKLIEMLGY